MSLTAAGLTAQLISFVLLISGVVLFVGPWMKRQPLAIALSLPLWVHAFRYVALQIFSAQRFGLAVSDTLASEIAWGDVAATILAVIGLWLLHYRSAAARLIIWLLVVESVADLLNATVGGIRENALETAQSVTWLILNVYVPSLWVSVGLMVWQLVARRGDTLSERPSAALTSSPAPAVHPEVARRVLAERGVAVEPSARD